jgi:signal transduction histidine kinase
MRQLAQEAIKSENTDNGFSDVLFSAKISGESYYFMLAPISVGNQLAGFFLLGTPVDPDGQLHRLLFSLILGMLGTLAIAMVGGFWLADRAIHPVKKITQTARTIGETDLSQRLNLEQRDELGELADTFDEMLDRLQAAFERQRQFTADASHELRTPLTIVELEASRALAASRSPQEYIRTLRVIQSENQFMTRMVSNLLTLARMDAGQVVLHKQELDLSDVVLDVVERLAPLAKKNQVKLTAGDLPELPVMGDQQFLVQMVSNLVDNAIKYSSGEDKCIEVMTGNSISRQVQKAWVRVIDNGPGIPPEHLPHLFDRFYQVDKARAKQDQDLESQGSQTPSGTGLGLSIAKWIAQAHGGEIRVQSELGKGTTFEIYLPLSSSPS